MDLQIGMTPDGKRYVYDASRLPDDVDAWAEDFICPPEALEADGFASAKAAREYIRKREGKPVAGWKFAPSRDGFRRPGQREDEPDPPDYWLHHDGKHVATVRLVDEDGHWGFELIGGSESDDEWETLTDAMEAAEEAAEEARHG